MNGAVSIKPQDKKGTKMLIKHKLILMIKYYLLEKNQQQILLSITYIKMRVI